MEQKPLWAIKTTGNIVGSVMQEQLFELWKSIINGGDRNDVVGPKNQDPKKREIILFFK
jgi:hypothetical protein